MPTIDALRFAALKVVTHDPRFASHTLADLDRYVLSTGYAGAPQSYEQTRDLLYVYTANLRNAGGPGVNMHRFGSMVVGALAEQIDDNRIVPLHLPDLARRCLAWLDTSGSLPLVRKDDALYRKHLHALADGQQPSVPFQRHLQSVIGFIDLLNAEYGGRADRYHASFSSDTARRDPARAVVTRLNELHHLPGIGVATGLNFMKDSQVPRFSSAQLVDMLSEPLAWFVKPDMHVLRLMLHVSGRYGRTGLPARDLTFLKPVEAAQHYAELDASAGWFHTTGKALSSYRPRSERGLWTCVGDVHAWAAAEGAAPLEIDRLLYMIGSGRYFDGVKIGMSQPQRYETLMQAIRGTADGL